MSYAPRKFGIITDAGQLTEGLIANSLTFNDTVDTAEARGLSGEIIDEAAYSSRETVSIQGLWTGEGIKAGSQITLGSKDYLVSNSTRTESNQDFVQGSIDAMHADNATIWPLSTFIGA